MSLRRIGVLFAKDLRHGSRSVIFILAIVLPLVLSLAMGLLFGTLFSANPKLGIADSGASSVTAALSAADFLDVQRFESSDALLKALDTGTIEVGLLLPEDFDAAAAAGTRSDVTIYVWGQSLVKNRVIIASAVTEAIVDVIGRENPITVNSVLVGDRAMVSWQQRLLPLIVLMSVMIGGIMVPATSLIEERNERTIRALLVTPMALGEVYVAKGLMGIALSVFSGVAILTLNGGWGPNPVLLLAVLLLGGTLAAAFGLLLGTYAKDIQTLMAIIKALGILLYAPGLIGMFPDTIPQWIAQLFPTYYIMHPVMDISQRGAGLGDIAMDLVVLAAITAGLIFALGTTADRMQVREA